MGPQVVGGVAAPRRPVGAAVGEVEAEVAAAARRTTRSEASRTSGSASGPHAQVVGGPRPDAGQREQRGADLVAVGAGVECEPAVGDRARPARARHRARGPRHRQVGGVDVGQHVRRTGTAATARRRTPRSPCCGDDARRARCARRPDRDLLADDGRAPPSRSRRRVPGARSPGRLRTSGASAGRRRAPSSTATGSASRSSSRRTRATTATRSRGVGEPDPAEHRAVARPTAPPAPGRSGAAQHAGEHAVDVGLEAGHGVRAEEVEHRRQRSSARGRAGAA